MSEKILIIGAGAIGSFYGSLLAKTEHEVSVVARSDYDFVAENGINIESTLGHWIFNPCHVVKTVADYPEQADFVVICTKVTDEVNRIELMRGAIGPDTVIVLIQNGINIEADIAKAFPDNLLISGLAFICVTRIKPGSIQHTAYGRLIVGNYPQGVTDKTYQFATLFEDSGIDCKTTDNVVTARWQKTVWNAPFNPLSVLSDGLDTHTMLNTQEPYIRAIMSEVAAIAKALGHPLRADIVDLNIESTRQMDPYKTSMLLDFEHGRTMEIESILGNAVRAAQNTGIPTPYLSSLYSLMKLRTCSRS